MPLKPGYLFRFSMDVPADQEKNNKVFDLKHLPISGTASYNSGRERTVNGLGRYATLQKGNLVTSCSASLH